MLSPAFVTPTPLARPPPTRLLHSRHRTPVAVAAHSLDHYRSLEGFSSPSQIFLPNAIIYSSLRRRLERSALAAAVDFITQLAGSSDVAAPAKSLSPREVVRTVLAALQRSDAAEVLTFASEKNRLKNCSPETLLSWLKASEYKFLLDIGTYFVAPNARSYGPDRKSCVLSCVVNTSKGDKRALSFAVSKYGDDGWMIDNVSMN